MWVNANIEETNIGRLKVGQPVIVHVDALNADIPGRVEAVTPATANIFSLLPSSNASGNFTKVIQLVPVRVSVNLGNQPMLLGANEASPFVDLIYGLSRPFALPIPASW